MSYLLSLVPWWAYAIAGAAAYVAARVYLSATVANWLAIAALVATSWGFVADQREAEIRRQWAASVERAKAKIKADDVQAARDSAKLASEEKAALERELRAAQEKYNALLAEADTGCRVDQRDADRVQPPGRR